jgi:hypothetical protein
MTPRNGSLDYSLRLARIILMVERKSPISANWTNIRWEPLLESLGKFVIPFAKIEIPSKQSSHIRIVIAEFIQIMVDISRKQDN